MYTHYRFHDNVQVETPLKTAKKSILLSADMYDTRYSLNQYVCVTSTIITLLTAAVGALDGEDMPCTA